MPMPAPPSPSLPPLQSVVVGDSTIDGLMEKVQEAAEKKQPSDDGFYYVNKSEILKATGLDEEGYKDFVYSARIYGYLENSGKWFRITNNNPINASGGVTVPNSMGAQMANMSIQASGPALGSIFTLPCSDQDPIHASEGETYLNTKYNEIRVYTSQGWMKIGLAPASP